MRDLDIINHSSELNCLSKISSYILFFILIFLPFDSYLGETINFPIVPTLLLLFIILRILSISLNNYNKIELTPILFYISFGIILNVIGFIKVGVTYNFLLYFFNIAFFFTAIVGSYDKKDISLYIKSAPISLFIFIFISLKHMKFYDNTIYMGIRDICDPNYLITGLVLVISMQVFLIFKEKKYIKKILYLFELFLSFGLMILIGSRGGLLACLFTVFVSIIVASRHPIKLLCFFGLVFLLTIMIVFPKLPDNLLKRFDIIEMIHGTGSGRTIIWKNYLNLYLNSNIFTIIFGFGRDYVPSIYFNLFGKTGYYSHNLYVKSLAEGGIVGVFLFVIMLFWSIKRLYQSKNGVLLSAFLGMLVGSIFLDMDNMRIFWLLLFFITLSDNGVYMWRGNYEIFDNSSNI